MAQLLGVVDVSMEPKDRHARHLAHTMRKPLLERASLPEEWFAPLMAAAVNDPDPSFCRWFVEPAVYAFGRRSVMAALVDYLRTGTDAERAGAVRAWYSAHVPLRADRSPVHAPGGVRDPGLDETRDIKVAWTCGCSPNPPTSRRSTASCWTCLPPAQPIHHPCTNYLKAHSHPPGSIPTRTSVAGPQQQTTRESEPDPYPSWQLRDSVRGIALREHRVRGGDGRTVTVAHGLRVALLRG
ncbi:hypothetical protein [Streptomyces sp. NPDC101132]|uniref:hypothetical protein n=1 Tax=Streptomyces sp. NPDC101132 TaxID=3366110 RepID=UPI0038045A07